ncbi:MAG: HMA2 domain-containing protein [Thermodesulfobacteriota bacterium]
MGRELKGITVAHALPGRVRLKIPRLKENPELARQAQAKLNQAPGIQGVEANPATGSLLILYDLALLASMETLEPLGEIFAELFPEVALEELAAGLQELLETESAAHPTGGLLGVLNIVSNPGLARNLNLNLLLPLTLLFLGVRSLFASKEVRFPAWYDYLWFGFSTFVMLNRKWVEETPPSSPAP